MTLEERIKNTVKTKGFDYYKECLGVDGLSCFVGSNAGPDACALNIEEQQGKRRRKRHGQSIDRFPGFVFTVSHCMLTKMYIQLYITFVYKYCSLF
jgi:hypothetical protein